MQGFRVLSRHGGRPAAWVMLIVGFGVLGALGVLRGCGPAAEPPAGAGAAPEAISLRAIPAPLPGESATGGAPTGELTITDRPGAAPAVPAPAPVGASGVPGVPLAAYQRAEHILASTAPDCRLRWSLLAAMGRAESGHASGGRVDAAGRTLGRILGPRLDGTNGRARVPDTDGGALDGDRNWDRAVGPMQLLPSVWRRYATAAAGRPAPDPDNVFDAALAAGRFLCAGGADLDVPDRQAEAIRRYRDSPSYLAAVRAWSAGYAEGNPSVPLVRPTPKPPSRPLAAPPSPRPPPPTARPRPPSSATRKPAPQPSSSATRKPAAVPKPSASSVPEPRPSVRPPTALPKSPPAMTPGPMTPGPPTPTDSRFTRPTTTAGPTRASPRPEAEGDQSTRRDTSTDGTRTGTETGSDRSPSHEPTSTREPSGSNRSEGSPSARPTPSSSTPTPSAGPTGAATPTSPNSTVGPIIVVEPTATPAAPSGSPRSTEAPGPTGMAVPRSAGSPAPHGGGPSGSVTPTPSAAPAAPVR
jgi:hypothetical protein